MARVDESGVHGFSLAEYQDWFEARFRAAFGADLALDPETPAGQWIGIAALAMTECDEALVAVGNAMSVDHAAGGQLDDLGSLTNVERSEESHSTVTVTVAGVAGTMVAAGSRARTATGTLFETEAAVVLTPAGVSAEMRAVEAGPVEAAAGEINIIVTAIAGWETITNSAAATPGVAEEPDTSYRGRYQARTARLAPAYLDALAAALFEAGVSRIRSPVIENDTNVPETVAGMEIRPHSILAIVEGGTDTAVSAAVLRTKGMGVSPMTAIQGGAHSILATLQAFVSEDFVWSGETFSGIDLSGAADFAAVAALIQTAIRTSSDAMISETTVAYIGAAFVIGYPWRPDRNPIVGAGALATALGLSAALATESPGPFLRARTRALAVTTTVAVQAGFPADGLAQIRAAIAARIPRYGIGERPRHNDVLVVIEGVPGAHVTALSVTDDGTAIDSVAVPPDVSYQLAPASLEITLTGIA